MNANLQQSDWVNWGDGISSFCVFSCRTDAVDFSKFTLKISSRLGKSIQKIPLRNCLTMNQIKTILVLCTGNSARSILGEAIFNLLGGTRLRAYSAGSKPKGMPHPGALRLLAAKGIDTTSFRSKSWDEFTGASAPKIDLVITVCGNAAGEACPVFPGNALRTHWGLPDPADVGGCDAEVDSAFAETWRLLEMRVRAFLAMELSALDAGALTLELNRIGAMEGAA